MQKTELYWRQRNSKLHKPVSAHNKGSLASGNNAAWTVVSNSPSPIAKGPLHVVKHVWGLVVGVEVDTLPQQKGLVDRSRFHLSLDFRQEGYVITAQNI